MNDNEMCGNCAHERWRHGYTGNRLVMCLHIAGGTWCSCDEFIASDFEVVTKDEPCGDGLTGDPYTAKV